MSKPLGIILALIVDVPWVKSIFIAFHLRIVCVKSHFVLVLTSFMSCFSEIILSIK